MKAILVTTSTSTPLSVEVTDHYIKVVHRELEAPYAYTEVLAFDLVADIHIVHRGDVYQVSAWDSAHREIYRFRPRTHDLGTCQRFLDAFYALTRRPVPAVVPSMAPAQ